MNARVRGTRIQEGLPLDSRIERCARMLAIHFLAGSEGDNRDIFARQIAFYRIPREAVGVMISKLADLLREEALWER